MRESRYGKVLTAILIVIIIGVVALLSFFGYDVYQKFSTKKAVAQVLNEFNANAINKK